MQSWIHKNIQASDRNLFSFAFFCNPLVFACLCFVYSLYIAQDISQAEGLCLVSDKSLGFPSIGRLTQVHPFHSRHCSNKQTKGKKINRHNSCFLLLLFLPNATWNFEYINLSKFIRKRRSCRVPPTLNVYQRWHTFSHLT